MVIEQYKTVVNTISNLWPTKMLGKLPKQIKQQRTQWKKSIECIYSVFHTILTHVSNVMRYWKRA